MPRARSPAAVCDLDEALDSAGRLRMFLQAMVGVAVAEGLAAGAILALRGRVYEGRHGRDCGSRRVSTRATRC